MQRQRSLNRGDVAVERRWRILNVWHPTYSPSYLAKDGEGDIANFNLSVMVDEKFMDLVSRKMYDTVLTIHPSSGESITVGQIWSEFVDGIWKNGEPGNPSFMMK